MDRYNEYRYRRLFQCTHEEYLDTPYEDIEWMLHMDQAVNGKKANAPSPGPPPGLPPTPRIT